jgi:hypothetical protein
MKKINFYAFWRYDLYPYTLYGKITKEFEDKNDKYRYGKVRVEGYDGYMFTPFLILAESSAKPIIKELEKLKESYDLLLESAHESYSHSLKNLIPNHPNFNEKRTNQTTDQTK